MNENMNLSIALQIFVREGYNVNVALESFQFLFSETKLNGPITARMVENVRDMLVNNNAPKCNCNGAMHHSHKH